MVWTLREVSYEFTRNGKDYRVRFTPSPENPMSRKVVVYEDGVSIYYRAKFWGGQEKQNAIFFLEQALKEEAKRTKTETHETQSSSTG